jgi:hypothetical protein
MKKPCTCGFEAYLGRANVISTHLKTSAALEKMCKTSAGRRARCAFALSEALFARGDDEAAMKECAKAKRLRKQAPTYANLLDEESEEAYDRLVFITLR